ncbi:hypothetical protein [Psychroserpens luteolus]|uniref:hypothetical protein n=1 Tax=Psychroserpens luteolus TaxID=2855840 RepID=UPI001E30806F|nr:hypothetical protein [Psychroserpens luteolus]MCD2258306.1 hypothetical protein [Psychroserpens luteolus]
MKIKHLLSIVLLLFISSTTTQLNAQNYFENDLQFNEFSIPSETTIDLRTYEVTLDDGIEYDTSLTPKSITQYEAQENAVAFVLNMIAFGVGFGFTDADTLWCMHAEYYLRLALFQNAAFYGAFGLGYSSINGDFLNTNLLDLSLKLLMVSILAKQYQQVRLQYGVFAKYAFGKNKFNDGFKNDLTVLTAGVILGLHILLTTQWSLMVQTNLLTYEEQTIKSEGNETKSDSTIGLINKNNILALSLVYTFGRRNRK